MDFRNQKSINVNVFLNVALPILGDETPVKIALAASQLLFEIAKKPNNVLCPLRNNVIAEFIRQVNIPFLKSRVL